MRNTLVGILLLGALVATSGIVAAETVDDIVAANLEAKGGEEAWIALETGRMRGTMRMGGGAAGAIEVPFTIEFKKPDMLRLEFTMQGMTAVQAFDGETGWAIMPFLGKTEPEEMAEDQVQQLKNQADFEGVLVNWKEKGHTVELIGKEEVDGTPAYKLKVTRDNGDVDYLFLDEEYFVEFKIEAEREVQGTEVTVSTVVGDYKEVDGLLFAHSMEMSYGGGEVMQVITIEDIELGVDLPDDRFTMPAATEAETEGGDEEPTAE
jgi:outer membrane lipoprotein-sorting protein